MHDCRLDKLLILALALMASFAWGAPAPETVAVLIASTSDSTGKDVAASNAEAFDALLERIGSHGDEESVNDAAYRRNRLRLVALLPPGDAVRAARLSAFDCYELVALSRLVWLTSSDVA